MADQYEGTLADIPVYFTVVDERYCASKTSYRLLIYPQYWDYETLCKFTSLVRETWGTGFSKPKKGYFWKNIQKNSKKIDYVHEWRGFNYYRIYLQPSALYNVNFLLKSSNFLEQVKEKYKYQINWLNAKNIAEEKLAA